MVDIAKCKGIDCPLVNKCYRYTAPANEYRQTYADFKYDREQHKCEDFYPDGNPQWENVTNEQ